jgi:crotonobetainyl-CoA:carnitine CoA-transferase CaiB-like acyl-CoA transferase
MQGERRQAGALEGVRVLDLGTFLGGPFCSTLLGEFGADVIKVERPRSGDPLRLVGGAEVMVDGTSLFWAQESHDKRCITCDLRHPQGQALMKALVRQMDVVVENFTPGTLERWGLGYDDLRAVKPGIIMVRVSGYGQTGPNRHRPGFARVAHAYAGLTYLTGEPGGPPLTPGSTTLADYAAGLFAAFGAVVALRHRERTGEGQVVDGSLLQGQIAAQAFNITSYLMSGTYGGSPLPRIPRGLTSPLWNQYKAKDGKWLMIGMPQFGRYWPPFREAIHEATGEWLEPERLGLDWMRTNATDLMQLITRLDGIFATQPSAFWRDLFRRYDFLFEVVSEYRDLENDPQITENGMFATLDHPTHGPLPIVGPAINLSATPGSIRTAAPEFGQHTEEVLLEAGLNWDEIANLRDQGVIGARVADKASAG